MLSIRVACDDMVEVAGEVDASNASALATALSSHARVGALRVRMADVAFIDSAGVHALLDVARRIGQDGRLVVCDPAPAVARLLHLLDVDNALELTGTDSLRRAPD